jgi:hypothetical protein
VSVRFFAIKLLKTVATDCFFRFSSHRFRPQNSLELKEGGDIVVTFDDNLQTVGMRSAALSTGPEKDGFTFDRVFPMETKQHEVFDYGIKGCVSPACPLYFLA